MKKGEWCPGGDTIVEADVRPELDADAGVRNITSGKRKKVRCPVCNRRLTLSLKEGLVEFHLRIPPHKVRIHKKKRPGSRR